MASLTSKVSSKAQTVLPKIVREKLGVKPGDTLRYRETEQGMVIEKVEDYARRKGMSIPEVERWLGPILNYDPARYMAVAAE